MPFSNLRGSGSERWTTTRIDEGRPGSSCPRGYLASNTELGPEPLCTASRAYQRAKLAALGFAPPPPSDTTDPRARAVYEKQCICNHLGNGALVELGAANRIARTPCARWSTTSTAGAISSRARVRTASPRSSRCTSITSSRRSTPRGATRAWPRPTAERARATPWRVRSPSSQANERALRASHLFAHVDEALVSSLAQTAVRKQLARGDALWRAGARATHFTVIASGLMKIARHSADGTDAIVAIFGPRESIGDVAVVRRATYPADAIAASTTVEMILVDAAPVLTSMQSNALVADAINKSLVEHTQALQEKIRIMTAGAVPQRLATLLLHLAERFGDETDDGATFVPVALTRIELARLIGATVETTIRAMSRWQKRGWIETTHDGFRLTSLLPLSKVTAGDDHDE